MPQLTEEQRRFVFAPPGVHQSMQSWAGTGKTHTLTERVVRLLKEHAIAPETIVVTTFTVEGARECLKRLNGRMGADAGVRVGTMDSLASQWMRQYFQPVDYYTGVQEYGTLLLDFLRSPEGHKIKSRVSYLVVDEFQDLSKMQLDMVMEFYRAGTFVLAIGDVAQNIYEWRGCHGHFLSSLPQRIPDMLEFHLTENRRCTPEIIDVGNACLAVLRHKPGRLMRPVRDSLRIRPILDTLEPNRSLGAHVIKVLRRYRANKRTVVDALNSLVETNQSICFGDMAIIGRYKKGLFNVEEALIKANRFAPCVEQVIPFATSLSVGDADRLPTSFRKAGHATMMTLHQAKGLEWPVVILVLWDADVSDEEWRLMYVAVTRARDHLHIVSANENTTRAFLEHMPKGLFAYEGSLDFLNVSAEGEKEKEQKEKKKTKKKKTTRCVVDIVRSLSCEQIQEMRARELIPMSRGLVRASPGCKLRLRMFAFQKQTETFSEVDPEGPAAAIETPPEDDVDANGFQLEFGNFADRYITRLFFLELGATGVTLDDTDTRELLETAYINSVQFAAMTKHADVAAAFFAGTWTRVELLERLMLEGADRADVQTLHDAFDRIAMHCRHAGIAHDACKILEGRSPMTFVELGKLRESFAKYTDSGSSTADNKKLFHVFRVSLSSVILKGRKSIWYHPDAFTWFRAKLNFMMPCIKRFVADVVSSNNNNNQNGNNIELKTKFRYADVCGEADLTTPDTVVDFKCSKRLHDFAWLAQGLTYIAMSTSTQPNKLKIFNPVMQSIWEYDCTDWPPDARRGYIDYLVNGKAAANAAFARSA